MQDPTVTDFVIIFILFVVFSIEYLLRVTAEGCKSFKFNLHCSINEFELSKTTQLRMHALFILQKCQQTYLCIFYYILFCWITVTGTLKGYDQLLNLVLDEAVEFLRGKYY